jgi:pimeloyl-ACP methyl ester carboxylesterase
MGVSDPDPDRSLTDWPEDLRDLLDTLDVETAPVLGISGGGPHAAAAAALLDDRVPRAGIACGVAPTAAVEFRERLWYYTARFATPASELALWLLGRRVRRDPEGFLDSFAEDAAPADGPLWRGDVGRVVHASMVESSRHHGPDPLVRETAIYGSPWGFDLAGTDVPVYLRYGEPTSSFPSRWGSTSPGRSRPPRRTSIPTSDTSRSSNTTSGPSSGRSPGRATDRASPPGSLGAAAVLVRSCVAIYR